MDRENQFFALPVHPIIIHSIYFYEARICKKEVYSKDLFQFIIRYSMLYNQINRKRR
jgi:hypothetical protein